MSQAPQPRHRLVYDGMEFILSPKNPHIFCLTTDAIWSVPGGTIATTTQLVNRATQLGKQVQLLTVEGVNRKIQLLTEEEREND